MNLKYKYKSRCDVQAYQLIMMKGQKIVMKARRSFHHEKTTFEHVNCDIRLLFCYLVIEKNIMKLNKQSINTFFQTNTLWIYLVLFLLFSALLTVSVMKDTWGNYGYYSSIFCVIYFPVLLFSYFRIQISNQLPKWGSRLLWVLCFILHPLLVYISRDGFLAFLFPIEQFTSGLDQIEDLRVFRSGFLSTISISVIATEIVILINDYFKDWVKQNRFLQQVSLDTMLLFVLLLLAIFTGIYSTVEILEGDPNRTWWQPIYLIPYYAMQVGIILFVYYLFYYLNDQLLIPLFLKSKGVVYYGFAAIGLILILYPISVLFLAYLPIVQDVPLSIFNPDTSIFAKDRASIPTVVILLSAPVIVAMQWYQQDNQIVSLQKQKSETELNLLKQQINPHFFFNTLNNLYALSITKDQQTPEVILKLSELMRYVIYKGKEESVPLKEEIQYIEDYIQLQQIRLHKKLDFQFSKGIVNWEQRIPPLLFITFVENAFKHGIEPAGKDCFLHLSVITKNNQVTFTCKNSIEEKLKTPTGIGLTNLKRRLELRYPNQHILKVEETATQYHAMLQIDLL